MAATFTSHWHGEARDRTRDSHYSHTLYITAIQAASETVDMFNILQSTLIKLYLQGFRDMTSSTISYRHVDITAGKNAQEVITVKQTKQNKTKKEKKN